MTIWIIVAIGMIVFELITLGNLISIWFAFGAFAAALISLVTDNVVFQVVIFALVSIGSMILVRPLMNRTLRGKMISTNADSIIGRRFELTDEIAVDSWGKVVVDGSTWSCVSFDHKPIELGALVEVVAIAGVKLVVKKIGGEN